MKCPNCSNTDAFNVECTAMVRVSGKDNDIGENGCLSYNDNSFCECAECGHIGVVGEFDNTQEE